jgi:hypothetical protein
MKLKYSWKFFLFSLSTLTWILFPLLSSAAEETPQPAHPWQFGVFAQGGFPPDYQIHVLDIHYSLDLYFLSAGIEIGKETRRYNGVHLLRGRGEVLSEILPFWMARYPGQIEVVHFGPDTTLSGYMKGETFHGASVTPLQLRWNFSQRDSARVIPWAQMGCGILWTNHKFPGNYFTGGTSVFNFTPQVGAGVNIFNRPKHSIELGVKAIHISNASLGDNNPGLNQTLQFSAGYSWWK